MIGRTSSGSAMNVPYQSSSDGNTGARCPSRAKSSLIRWSAPL
jgi:hypothetical protein